MSESFYFRHDSIRNPQYETNMLKLKKQAEFSDQIREELSSRNIMKTIIGKITT